MSVGIQHAGSAPVNRYPPEPRMESTEGVGSVGRWLLILGLVGASCGVESTDRKLPLHAEPSSIDARLVLSDGSVFVLQGDTSEAGVSERTTYESLGLVESLDAYLVKVAFYEGWGYLLVSLDSGDTTWVTGPPVVSPSGRQFVTTSMDLEAEYNPTVLEIFRVNDGEFTREFELVSDDSWGPSDARWINEDTIEFLKNVLSERFEYDQTPARLVRTDSNWSVAPLPTEDSGG